MLNNWLLPTLSGALNTYLNLDPESKRRFRKLNGKTIAVEFLPLHLTCQCTFSEHGVAVQAVDGLQADATIRGTPMQMLGVMWMANDRQRFFAEDIQLEGDVEIANQVVKLFDELDIDWEELLAKKVGDVPAYHVGRLLRKMGGWLKQTEQSVTENINEFVHEEAVWLPTREALQDFYADIDNLRMQADRIEARLAKLMTSEFDK